MKTRFVHFCLKLDKFFSNSLIRKYAKNRNLMFAFFIEGFGLKKIKKFKYLKFFFSFVPGIKFKVFFR